MGAKQSKRSVDITTPTTENNEEKENEVQTSDKLQNGLKHTEVHENDEKDTEENKEEKSNDVQETENSKEPVGKKKRHIKWSFRSLSFTKKDKSKPVIVKDNSQAASSPEEVPEQDKESEVNETKASSSPAEESEKPVDKSVEEKTENAEETHEEKKLSVEVNTKTSTQSVKTEVPATENNEKDVQVKERTVAETSEESQEVKVERIVEGNSTEESQLKIEKTNTMTIIESKETILTTTRTTEISSQTDLIHDEKTTEKILTNIKENVDINIDSEDNGAGECLADLQDDIPKIKENGFDEIDQIKLGQASESLDEPLKVQLNGELKEDE